MNDKIVTVEKLVYILRITENDNDEAYKRTVVEHRFEDDEWQKISEESLSAILMKLRDDIEKKSPIVY